MSLAHRAQPNNHRSLSGDDEQAWRLLRADLPPITIIGLAIDGTVLSWDETAEHFFDVASARALGQSIFSVLPHLALDHLPHLMAKACTGERGGPIEFHAPRPVGDQHGIDNRRADLGRGRSCDGRGATGSRYQRARAQE